MRNSNAHAQAHAHFPHFMSIRIGLFNTAKRNDLVHQLVERRNTATRPVTWKLAEDIWELRTCVQMNKMVPRTLLRSGKRSKQQLDVQRVKTKEKWLTT